MTSKLTREQVIALITEHSYDSALVDALEYLLAAMHSEPVAEVCEDYAIRYISSGPAPKEGLHPGDKLYRHAQQPVVPDSGREQFEEWFKFHDDGENSTEKLQRTNGGANYLYPDVDLAWIVWKDSRSAMLQTAPAHLLPDKGHKWSYGLVHPENCQCIECRSARINGVKP